MTSRKFILVFVLLAGCAGDPELHSESQINFQFEEVERSRWETASPGCEDIDIAEATLYSCEGEPLLGALVDDDGRVLCIDAMSVLIEELRTITDPFGDDPSPQPSHPGLASMEPIDGSPGGEPNVTSTTTSGSSQADPTPTPVVRADPTPTPVTNPVLRDPDIAPLVQPEPDEEDPTPTPTMEQ